MVDRCIVDDCPNTAKFACSCRIDVKLCSDHLELHTSQGGEHKILKMSPKLGEMGLRAKRIIRSQQEKTSEIIEYGEQQIKDVFEKMRNMIDILNKRQKKILITAYSGNLSQDIVKEMGDISIDFDIEKEFEGIKSHLTKPDAKTVELYLEKFENISKKIAFGNDIMERISGDLIQKISEQEKNANLQVLNLQNSIDQNKDIIDKNIKKESDEIKKLLDEKIKKFSSELSSKNSDIYKIIEGQSAKIASEFKALDDETRRKIQQNADGIQKQLKDNYEMSLRSCEDKYRDLDSKLQKLQKQIKEINTTVGEIAHRYEQEKRERIEKIEKEINEQRERDLKEKERQEKIKRDEEAIEKERQAKILQQLQQGASKRSGELLNSTAVFETDFKTMKTQIDGFLERMKKAGTPDTAEVERTQGTLAQFIGVLEGINIRLRKAVNGEINGEEAVNMNAETTTLIVHLTEFNQICKSFLVLLNGQGSNIDSGYAKSFKITNDKQYYFYCNFNSDSSIY